MSTIEPSHFDSHGLDCAGKLFLPDGVERPLIEYLEQIPPVPVKETTYRGGPHPVDVPGEL